MEMDVKFWQTIKSYDFGRWKINPKSWKWFMVCYLFLKNNLSV